MNVWCLVGLVTSEHDNQWWSHQLMGIYHIAEKKPTKEDAKMALLQLGWTHFNRFTGKDDAITNAVEYNMDWVKCNELDKGVVK